MTCYSITIKYTWLDLPYKSKVSPDSSYKYISSLFISLILKANLELSIQRLINWTQYYISAFLKITSATPHFYKPYLIFLLFYRICQLLHSSVADRFCRGFWILLIWPSWQRLFTLFHYYCKFVTSQSFLRALHTSVWGPE